MLISLFDNNLVEQYKINCEHWKNISYGTATILKFLSQRGLCLEENETFGYTGKDNFLEMLELVSKYDSFSSNYIKSKC